MNAEERLIDLASSVADGAPVDWTAAESDAEDRERRLLRHLRLVSDVVELYRSLPETNPAPELAAQPQTGPKWGRLVLLDRVGEGTSSEVYRAWDPELQREVALKLLKVDGSGAEAARWRLLGEARRLARVRHSHVVVVFGADRRDDRVGLWMELVQGATLDDVVRRNGPLGAREAALVGLDVCGALAAVHAAGLAHRDLKAQNVMRETGGRIVLVDFGTGEELKHATGARLVGTPLYLAPEIFVRQPASVASDLYSLGVLLFYLVTGQFPIAAATFEELARAHQQRERRRLRDLRPNLPEAFVAVVERALSHDPALRYESAGGMEAALRQALDKTRPIDVVSAPPPSRPIWRWVGVAAAVAVAVALTATLTRRAPDAPAPAVAGSAPLTQIAVLPLADLSGGTAPPYLADALTDQLIATLGQVRALRVTSRTSVLQFKGGTTPVRDIARTLRIGSVLEGSIKVGEPSAAGTRSVTVNARLIEAGTDTQLWAQTLERQLGDAVALQADIARAVARAVNVVLSSDEDARFDQGQTTNQAAAEAYFQGRYHLNRFGTPNFRRAITAFERAIELDPKYALAHTGLARAHLNLGFAGAILHQAARASALASVTRALELDDGLAEAHGELADIRFWYDWDWQGAEAEYRRALELNPSYGRARTQFARLLAARGRTADAVVESRRAAEADPLSAETMLTVGLTEYYARDYSQAERSLRKALDLDPDFAGTHLMLARVYEAQRRWAEGIDATKRALALAGSPSDPGWLANVVRLQALAGDRSTASQWIADHERQTPGTAKYVAPHYLAYVHAALGREDRALELLESAVSARDPGVLWLKVDPRVDSLRKDARLPALVRRLGIEP